jgi:hypothetical protein
MNEVELDLNGYICFFLLSKCKIGSKKTIQIFTLKKQLWNNQHSISDPKLVH